MLIRNETTATIRRRLDRGEVGGLELNCLAVDPRAGVRSLAQRARRRALAVAAEEQRISELQAFERLHWSVGLGRVAGVDEVGMGPLAGPVMAAAVILAPGTTFVGIDDSKRLSRKRREALSEAIRADAVAYAFGSCSPEEIDALNIYQAGREAMRRAVCGLDPAPQHLLVDARAVAVPIPQTAIKGGDRRSQTIAAASILAKVERDRLMAEMADTFPGYGFDQHRGYPTRAHLRALRHLGPTPIHRRSFGPVRAVATAGLTGR